MLHWLSGTSGHGIPDLLGVGLLVARSLFVALNLVVGDFIPEFLCMTKPDESAALTLVFVKVELVGDR